MLCPLEWSIRRYSAMTATLHVLRPQTPPIAGYLRVGHTGHRKLLDLHAAGRLAFRRIVFDAAHFDERLRDALGDLHGTRSIGTRSRAVGFRGGVKAISAVLGR